METQIRSATANDNRLLRVEGRRLFEAAFEAGYRAENLDAYMGWIKLAPFMKRRN